VRIRLNHQSDKEIYELKFSRYPPWKKERRRRKLKRKREKILPRKKKKSKLETRFF